MSGINRVIILGRVGKDPETRYTSNDKTICNFTLATSYGRGDNEKTEWHRCVAWEKPGEIIGEYVKKGHLLYVEGELQTRKWQDKDGQDRYTTEINVRNFQLIGKTVRDEGDDEEERPARRQAPQPARKPAPAQQDFDDDIPF